ncbi:MAG: ribonuclease D [Alphaproteobacteria bacterium]|nr:MAG: ribonuclease D [Alphaproteobacteria bacterium]
MRIITETDALAEVCADLSAEPFVTVDTEFMRDSTYWPKLCLIQIAGQNSEFIIDPLADGLDLKPFYALMANEAVVKVFHAARQDVEIFFHFGGVIPHPLVDTQVAAMVCGFGDSVGYEALIRKVLGVQIDKSSRFTDWSRRPLKDKQLHYALGDVTHLRDAYPVLRDQVAQRSRAHWLEEEMDILTSPSTYELHPEVAWKRLKIGSVKPRSLGVLIEVAAWREEQAQSRDMPRQRILKDDGLYEVARQAPRSAEALDEIRGIPKGFSRSRHAATLLASVERGLNRSKDSLPKSDKPERLPQGLGPIVEMLKVLLKRECEIHEVAQKLVASMSDLEKLAADDAADIPALKGWRRELFGTAALDLKHGRLALSVEDTPNGPQIKLIEL